MKFKIKKTTFLPNHSHPKPSVIFREGFRHSLDREGYAGSQPTCGTWQPAHSRQGGACVRATCILIVTNEILPEFIIGKMQKTSFQRGKKKPLWAGWDAINFPVGSTKWVAHASATALPEAQHPERQGYGRIQELAQHGKQLYPQASTSIPTAAGQEK